MLPQDAKCSEPMECIFKDGKASFINRFGEAAVASNFEAASEFHEGLAAVKTNGKFSLSIKRKVNRT